MGTGILRRVEESPVFVRLLLLAAVVSMLTLAAYSNSFHAGFHLDDGHQITGNHYIRKLSNIPRFFTESGVNSVVLEAEFYRPVTTASFAVNYALNGLDLPGYHVFNLAVHILNALLVYLIVGFVLSRSGRPAGFALPFSASLLFALHPIQVGAVTYISGRAVLLAVFFSLGSLYAFMRYRKSKGGAGYLWGALSPILFLAGLLSKEMTAAVLAVMLCYDLIFGPRDGKMKPRAWLYYLSYIPCIAMYAWGYADVGNKRSMKLVHYGHIEYLMSQAKALLMYVRLLFLPVNQNSDYVMPVTKSVDIKVVLAVLLVSASLYALFRIRKDMPSEAFFGFWFFIGLLPESSVLPVLDIAVEYRMYMPSVGFITLAALLARRYVGVPAVRTAMFTAVLAMLGILTFNRNTVYADDMSYWHDVTVKSPQSARAKMAYGDALVVAGRYDEAIPVLKKSLTMDAPFREPEKVYANLGRSYYHLGLYDEAEENFRQAIGYSPSFMPAYDSLGELYYETGRYRDAVDIFSDQIRQSSGNPKAEYNLAASLMMLGRDDEAILHLLDAVEYGLDNFDVRYNLAVLYERTGRPDDALENANMAMGLAPGEEERLQAAELISRLGG